MSDIIKIFVEDQVSQTHESFWTTRQTLDRCAYLKSQLNHDLALDAPDIEDTSGYIKLNMNPLGFKNILNYLRGGEDIKPEFYVESHQLLHNEKLYKINVGGQIFTLCDSDIRKSGLLTSLMEDIQDQIFIDRDPQKFQVILHYLRGQQPYIPPDLLNELDFFMIDRVQIKLKYDPKPKTDSTIRTDLSLRLLDPIAMDLYYTGNPQITHFKAIYHRNTNFNYGYMTWDQVSAPVKDQDNVYTLQIPRMCGSHTNDFSNLYLILEFDLLSQDSLEWIDQVESFVCEYIEVYGNDQLVHRIESEAMYIWNHLQNSQNKSAIQDQIQNKSSLQKLIIPCSYFMGSNLPLFPQNATTKTQLSLKIKIRNLEKLILNPRHQFLNQSLTQLSLVTKTILLDNEELRRFVISSHEYLIETNHTYHLKLQSKQLDYSLQFDSNHEQLCSINTLFFYFKDNQSVLPMTELGFQEFILMVDDQPYIKIDTDLLQIVCRYEPNHQYNLEPIWSYNLSYVKSNATVKGCPLTSNRNISLHIKMKPGFTSKHLVVVARGEQLLRIQNGLLDYNLLPHHPQMVLE